MIRKAIKLVMILIWMGLIFMFSNDNATISTKKSDGVIISSAQFFMRRQLNDKEKEQIINILVVPVRKCAHFTLYLILGLLVFGFLKEFGISWYKVLLITIGICFLYSCSDEVHQLFVPGRSCEIFDVFIDTMGSFVGSLLYFGISKLLNKEKIYE